MSCQPISPVEKATTQNNTPPTIATTSVVDQRAHNGRSLQRLIDRTLPSAVRADMIELDPNDARTVDAWLEWCEHTIRRTGRPAPLELRSARVAVARAIRIAASGKNVATTSTERGSLISITDAAALSGVPVRTLRHRAASGQIPGAQRIGGRWMIPN